jgi:hypothetical protein
MASAATKHNRIARFCRIGTTSSTSAAAMTWRYPRGIAPHEVRTRYGLALPMLMAANASGYRLIWSRLCRPGVWATRRPHRWLGARFQLWISARVRQQNGTQNHAGSYRLGGAETWRFHGVLEKRSPRGRARLHDEPRFLGGRPRRRPLLPQAGRRSGQGDCGSQCSPAEVRHRVRSRDQPHYGGRRQVAAGGRRRRCYLGLDTGGLGLLSPIPTSRRRGGTPGLEGENIIYTGRTSSGAISGRASSTRRSRNGSTRSRAGTAVPTSRVARISRPSAWRDGSSAWRPVTAISVRWERAPSRSGPVCYYVDDTPVGCDDERFDWILDLAESLQADVTKWVGEGTLGGGDLSDSFPFKDRMGESRERLGPRRLTYAFG